MLLSVRLLAWGHDLTSFLQQYSSQTLSILFFKLFSAAESDFSDEKLEAPLFKIDKVELFLVEVGVGALLILKTLLNVDLNPL